MPKRRNGNCRFCVLPGYNWCGPGCSGPDAPVNDVDAACKTHDECYRNGRSPCECDREFIQLLQTKINGFTEEGRHARMLYHYMKIQTIFTCNSYRQYW